MVTELESRFRVSETLHRFVKKKQRKDEPALEDTLRRLLGMRGRR